MEDQCFKNTSTYARRFDFGSILPMPPGISNFEAESWARTHWGTKWNASRTSLEGRCDGLLAFSFETPVYPPLPVIEKLASQFPSLQIESTDVEAGEVHRFGVGADCEC
ncbi:hypothetical protein [Pararhizobium arenae]|uniref:DUF1281 family ferredoxin-like fold protein n=1 Tax=Pararhizobium arenae TaxID=1856850 RepID=UPI003CCA343D